MRQGARLTTACAKGGAERHKHSLRQKIATKEESPRYPRCIAQSAETVATIIKLTREPWPSRWRHGTEDVACYGGRHAHLSERAARSQIIRRCAFHKRAQPIDEQ